MYLTENLEKTLPDIISLVNKRLFLLFGECLNEFSLISSVLLVIESLSVIALFVKEIFDLLFEKNDVFILINFRHSIVRVQ